MRNQPVRAHAAAALGAVVYALFASFGWQVQHTGGADVPKALLIAVLLAVPAYLLLMGLLRLAERTAVRGQAKSFGAGKAWLFLFACYVPMFAAAYPGSFAYDVPFQLRQVFTGEYSTHHPLLHTLLLGGCVRLGQALGRINLGAALYTVIQMALLSGCFAAACASLARSCSVRAARWSTLFFAVYPLHMFMAVNATKDVLFAGLFALTLALALEMAGALREGGGARRADGDARQTRRLSLTLVLCGAGMMLLRNNALYAVVVWMPVLAVFLRRRGVRLIACLLAAVLLYVGANNALKAATGAVDGDLSEMLSIPIQQMARARNVAAERLTQAECEAIGEIMPQESWRLYDPTISDPVKFEFATDVFLADAGRYAGVYLSVGAKCLDVYIDALLAHTLAFWYPYSEYGVSGYYLQMGVSAEQTEQWCSFPWIEQTSPLRRVVDSLSWRFGAKGAMQIPVVGYLFNMGAIVWVMLFFVLREMYAGRWGRFALCLLPVLLWGTFLLGPVMAGRYIYPFVCVLPVMASRPAGE